MIFEPRFTIFYSVKKKHLVLLKNNGCLTVSKTDVVFKMKLEEYKNLRLTKCKNVRKIFFSFTTFVKNTKIHFL